MSSLRALLAMCAVLVTVLASTSASAWTPPATEVAPTQTTTKAKTRVGDFCKRGAFSLRAPALLLVGTHQENRVARAKSTSEACFLTQDPIGVAGGANLYAFVGNSPLDRWDPFGLDPAPQTQSVQDLYGINEGFFRKRANEAESMWASDSLGLQVAGGTLGTLMSPLLAAEDGMTNGLLLPNNLYLFWKTGDTRYLTAAGYSAFDAAGTFVPALKPLTGLRNTKTVATGLSSATRTAGVVDDGVGGLRKAMAGGASKLRAVTDIPKSLLRGTNGADLAADTHVYLGIVGDEVTVYVGITNDVLRRQVEHGARFVLRQVTDGAVTRRQARAIEQAFINENPGYQNIKNSIAIGRDWYDEAVDWGTSWLRANGY